MIDDEQFVALRDLVQTIKNDVATLLNDRAAAIALKKAYDEKLAKDLSNATLRQTRMQTAILFVAAISPVFWHIGLYVILPFIHHTQGTHP